MCLLQFFPEGVYNDANGITPETIKRDIGDILESVYEGDHVTPDIGTKGGKALVGGNLQAHLDGLRKDMMTAAENLEFEEAARLRDEVKRLEAVELTIADDPLARQSAVESAGGVAGAKPGAPKARSTSGRPGTRVYRGKSQKKR